MHHHHHHHRSNSPNKSRVKVVHNVAKGPAVNVVLDGNIALSGVEYKTQSDYLKIPSGKHSVSIAAGGNTLASADVDLKPNTDYTVIAHGDVTNLSSISLLALQDNNACPARGKSHLRFVHAAAGAPAVDVWASDSARAFLNVSYGQTGNPEYFPVDAGVSNISVTPADSTQRVLGPLPLNLEEGKVYTVTASGLIGDSDAPLTALVHEDKKCSVNMSYHNADRGNVLHNNRSMAMMPLWLNL